MDSLLVHPIFWLFLFVYGIFVIYRLKLHNFITILIFTIIFSCLINWPKPIDEPVIKGEIINLDENSIVLKTKETKVKVYGEFVGYEIGDGSSLF